MSTTQPELNIEIVRNPPRHRPPCPFAVDDGHRPEVAELPERVELEKRVEGARDRWEAATGTVPRPRMCPWTRAPSSTRS
jgi:hypothetical protein